MTLKIKNKTLKRIFGKNSPIFVAELSANHNGKLSIAKKLIRCAKNNGADAVKLQTYKAETMALPGSYFEFEDGSTMSQYDFFKKYEISDDDQPSNSF